MKYLPRVEFFCPTIISGIIMRLKHFVMIFRRIDMKFIKIFGTKRIYEVHAESFEDTKWVVLPRCTSGESVTSCLSSVS